jgi:hypothetical protein
MTKIDELMRFFDEAVSRAQHTPNHVTTDRDEFKSTLEAALKQGEVVAMRGDFDGYGYKYIDSGSGSDWRERHPDWEPMYDGPLAQTPEPPRLTMGEINALPEAKWWPCNMNDKAVKLIRATETLVRKQAGWE